MCFSDNFTASSSISAGGVLEGSVVQLECLLHKQGGPAVQPKLTWYDQNTTLHSNQTEDGTIYKNVLNISLGVEDNGKTFRCVVKFHSSDEFKLPHNFVNERHTVIHHVLCKYQLLSRCITFSYVMYVAYSYNI